MTPLLALATGLAYRTEDTLTGLAYGISIAGIAVLAAVMLAAPVLRLRSEQVWDDRQTAVVYGPRLDAVREVAAGSPGGMPDWAVRDVNASPGAVAPQPAYTGDPLADVEAIFIAAKCPPLPPDVHAVGHASIPPGSAETWRDFDAIAADLACLSPTQVLPTVGPEQPVRLR